MPTITLLPTQVDHVAKLKGILRQHPLALDLSMLGAGKTYTASHIALDPDFHFSRVVVIAPVSVQPKWNEMRSRFGVPISHNISYSQLRSIKCKQPKHSLLMRRDYTTDTHVHGLLTSTAKVEFTTTKLFRGFIDEGVLLVVDEIQSVKNISSQFLACRALIRAVVESGPAGASRVLLLSGSPIDRLEQAVALFRTMHVMRCDELAFFNIGRLTLEWRGMLDIETHCRDLDDDGVMLARARNSMWKSRLEKYCYDLFQSVFKPARSSAMPVQPQGSSITKLNAFFEVTNTRDRAALAYGVDSLSKACMFNSSTGLIEPLHTGTNALDSLHLITRALLQIETGKIGVMVSAASLILDRDPNAKVVVCVNYSASLKDLVSQLLRYSPLVLQGSTGMHRRTEVLKRFQAPDTLNRLLIGNISVMSTGIDLDDKDGRFPRTALVNPNYSTISLYQLGHRFLRSDTRSDSNVLFVFGKHATELHLLEALARKSNVMKQTTSEQSVAGVVFPGEYERVDGDVLLEEERVLVRVVQPVTQREQAPTELAVEAREALVADTDEGQPGALEDH